MITVIGSINMDLVVETNRVPAKGETTLGNAFSTFFGGKGANQVVSIARLGKAAQMIGACGTDEYGKMALASLQQENVKTDHVFLVPDETTGIASIIVSDADNRIIVIPGANNRLTPAKLEQVKHEIINSELVVIQLEIPTETVHAGTRNLSGTSHSCRIKSGTGRSFQTGIHQFGHLHYTERI